jgi:excisionase family DNA binding protein
MRTLKIGTEDRLHGADSAAELLGVRPSTIRSWWATGRLPRLKIGRLSRVRESALLALIQSEPKTREV